MSSHRPSSLVVSGRVVRLLPVDRRCPSMSQSNIWDKSLASDVICDLRDQPAETILYAVPQPGRSTQFGDLYKVIVVFGTYPKLLCLRYLLTKDEFRLLLEYEECTWMAEGF